MGWKVVYFDIRDESLFLMHNFGGFVFLLQLASVIA
jgi:hypothetical protein